jgi:L,D-transpeptidase catalytic domain
MGITNRRGFLRYAVSGAAGLALSGTLGRIATAFASTPSAIRPDLLLKASHAFGKHGALITQRDIIAIADFSAASREPRFHLFNVHNGQTTTILVAHGKGSDPTHTGWVQSFSNMPGSEASSPGSYIVGETYVGQHGQSRRLLGLDPENDQAEARAIVIHPAWYVSETVAQEQGKLGRSQGCFAVSQGDIEQVLTRLGTGSLLFADKV